MGQTQTHARHQHMIYTMQRLYMNHESLQKSESEHLHICWHHATVMHTTPQADCMQAMRNIHQFQRNNRVSRCMLLPHAGVWHAAWYVCTVEGEYAAYTPWNASACFPLSSDVHGECDVIYAAQSNYLWFMQVVSVIYWFDLKLSWQLELVSNPWIHDKSSDKDGPRERVELSMK